MATAAVASGFPTGAAAAAATVTNGSSGGGFSPLTLFECTISNANMLLEGMSLPELVAALRILGSLYGRVVDIMEPGVGAACERPQPPQPQPPHSPVAPAKRPKLEEAVSADVKVGVGWDNGDEAADDGDDDGGDVDDEEEDDCCIVVVEDSLGRRDLSSSAKLSATRGQQQQPQQDDSSAAVNANYAKQLLRGAYKHLRGNGPHLYNFSRHWNEPANQRVTDRLVDYIVSTVPCLFISADELIEPSIVSSYYREESWRHECKKRVQRKCTRVHAKLSRRQKAFEHLLAGLQPDELEKYGAVLARDFTSSDEELDDAAEATAAGTATGGCCLRVRELTWESDEVRQMKRGMDALFLERFATQKQRASLQRCVRQPGCHSNRCAPADAPDWSVRPID